MIHIRSLVYELAGVKSSFHRGSDVWGLHILQSHNNIQQLQLESKPRGQSVKEKARGQSVKEKARGQSVKEKALSSVLKWINKHYYPNIINNQGFIQSIVFIPGLFDKIAFASRFSSFICALLILKFSKSFLNYIELLYPGQPIEGLVLFFA
jgi:hypothetical protein